MRMVEHIGFEPMTSSMPWKRASQLRQCPLRRKGSPNGSLIIAKTHPMFQR